MHQVSTLIDTHAHLDDEAFAVDRDEVVAAAAVAGVRRIINVGYHPARWTTTVALTKRYPSVVHMLGLHPRHADEWSLDLARDLEALLRSTRARAVGEIGLDYFRDGPSATAQRTAFAGQLDLAVRLKLPVVIHQRAAETGLIEVLRAGPTDLNVLLHSFDGTVVLAEWGLARGYLFGVGGLMTRAAAAPLRDVLRSIPLDRMVLETDAPYLVPAGIPGHRNEPRHVRTSAERLAELVSVSYSEVASLTTMTAERFFGPLVPRAEQDTPDG